MSTSDVHAAALASLPGAGPKRLGRLLGSTDTATAWATVVAGRVAVEVAPASVRSSWRSHATAVDLDTMARELTALDVVATSWHDDAHPAPLVADLDPAPICFRRGRPVDTAMRRVGIVGTRRASAVGREIARELGAQLASAGVVVVSGLALGIDGAAHRGALDADGAPPVAIVGSGLDIVYPARHRAMWDAIGSVGTLLSEAPIGARPDAWRFPARNRLIAAVSELLVVVESRAAGGSLLTVEQAIRRGVEVMAVPGSVRNGAAVGTNQLLADGCAPVRDVDDVLMALGLSTAGSVSERTAAVSDAPAGLPARRVQVLEAVDDGPTSIDQLVERIAAPASVVCAEIGALAADGLVIFDGARVRRT